MGRDLRTGAVFAGILVAAAALRLAGLGHHLAHDPIDFDEMNNFVVPILKMWHTPSPNPTVYSGYPGFFNWLAFLPVGIGQGLAGTAGAYVGGRLLVALFGILNVALTYRLCRDSFGLAGALLGAALMAVSRGPIRAAHFISPDVLVTTGALALLLVLRQARDRRAWITAGALCGLATAVKYTGLLTMPALAVGLLVRPERRRSLTTASAAAIAAFGLAAPYAVVATTSMGSGFKHSIHHYYGGSVEQNRALQGYGSAVTNVWTYFLWDVGRAGLVLALLGVALHRPRRALLPGLALIAATLLATGLANKVYPRHVLPATAIAIVLAAAGFEALLARTPSPLWRRWGGAALAFLVLAPPARVAVRMAQGYHAPTAADRAVAWVEGNLATGAILASAVDPFEPDPSRFEVRGPLAVLDLPPATRAHYDALVYTGRLPKELSDLDVAAEFCGRVKGAPCDITLLRPRTRPALGAAEPLASMAAAPAEGQPGRMLDGDPATAWQAPPGPTRVTLRWKELQTVVRVEIDVDRGATSWPQTIDWQGTIATGETRPLAVVPLRPIRRRRQRVGVPHGQAYVIAAPVPLTELHLVRSDGPAWGIAEIRVLRELADRRDEDR